jgi:hypothetical protein
MKGDPHGATATSNVTVTADVKLVSAGTYSITINGTDSITGLLLYAVDSNGTRFGSFTKPPAGFGPKTGCNGTTPATNTLGHVNPSPKTLPLTFTWSDGGYLAKTSLTASFAGVAMSKTTTVWYVLASAPIPGSSAAASGNATSPPTATSIMNSTSTATAGAGAGVGANSTANTTKSTDAYSYGASSSSTIQVYWSMIVVALLSVFATFLL